MTVLILAADLDPSADAMVTALHTLDTPVYRLNTAWFPTQLSVSAGLREGRWSGYLRTPAYCIELEDVRSIWYRSPETYRMPEQLTAAERHHAFLEAKFGLGGVLSSLPVRWVNHPARIAEASYKPLQLIRAQECGLAVPDTYITNEATNARRFIVEGPTVTKLLGSNTIHEDGVRKVAWTRPVSSHDLRETDGLEVTTHQFQRWVPKAYEARVIAIGTKLTAAAIHAGNSNSYVDWRSDYSALEYELVTPPSEVAEGVSRLLSTFELSYGALDFVVTPSGEWIFLEINPGGQYGWIESATGAPITETLAHYLASPAPRPEDT